MTEDFKELSGVRSLGLLTHFICG
uniref:Uncharacterized protein n=1 Tax=Anguilla anguilla TaxID=7936 RepID=A0A0E9T6M1_ANGAN